MFKKVFIIILLAAALGSFLFFRKYFNKDVPVPALIDRVPESDFLGRVYLLDLAQETNSMLFHNKIPFRDMFSYDFLLSKAKGFGLDIQSPTYLFADERGNWGAMIKVNDSSKVFNGILSLGKQLKVKSGMHEGQKTYQLENDSTFIAYGQNWFFFYKGSEFKEKLNYVINAYKGSASPVWKSFLKEKTFKDQSLVVYSNWKTLKENGIETAIFAHNSDTVSVTMLSYIRNSTPLKFSTKNSGWTILTDKQTDNSINIHIDMDSLRHDKSHILYRFLSNIGKKISFPTDEFMQAWNGDFSFRMGGTQKITQEYVESVMDENFEVTEVTKTQQIDVPGFSVLFSLNENGEHFIKKLFAKGILTHDATKYRILFSPPLYLKKRENYYIFHSGEKAPPVKDTAVNTGLWSRNGTKINFALDSLTQTELYGKIYIPIQSILKSQKFLQ